MSTTASPAVPILGTTAPPRVPLTSANALQCDRMIAAKGAGIILEAMMSSLERMAYFATSDDAYGRENNVMLESIEVWRHSLCVAVPTDEVLSGLPATSVGQLEVQSQ